MIRFLLDGKTVSVSGPPPTTTVLEFLRDTAGRSGTKEGCAEGDCGACTVVLGELAADRQGIDYRAINSCIRFLPTIDGRELVTVESLQAADGRLHPVQQAMVDCHGSQCGFCTPGFVMSLFGLYLNNAAPQRRDVVDALAGNLCRCTGYRPIVEAGCRMPSYPAVSHWSPADAQSPERRRALRALQRRDMLNVPGFAAPRTLEQFAATFEAAPHSLVLAGGTDVGLWVTKHLRELPPLLYIGEVEELQAIHADADGGLWIGAAVSLSRAWPALVAAYPPLAEQARRFASPPVCNSGTLCGNVANGSPIGDSMPALLALGAEVELRKGAQLRRLPLEHFYQGYRKTALMPGEFVAAVRVPPPQPDALFASYKLSKRFDQDISAVCAAFRLVLDADRVADARIAYGGMAAVPARATQAEQALLGQPWSTAAVDAACMALAADFQPLGDMRATSAYRLQTAGNLLRRFHLQTGARKSGAGPALRTAEAAA
jgi:xanthine dehydrogenase small subunit